jgi:hypothetical protein
MASGSIDLGNDFGPVTPGSGTVTSVGLSAPASLLSVANSPISTSGTLALSLVTQIANKVFSGPTTGSAAAPTFRSLVTNDLPNSNIYGSVYMVYPGGSFATIQSAINQAVTNGHTSAENSPATVLVFPNEAGGYTENLVLKDGVNVVGYSGKGKDYTVLINGSVTYTPTSATAIDAKLTLANLYFSLGSGKQINLTGTNPGYIFLRQCFITKTAGSDSLILMNGSNSSTIEYDAIDGNVTVGATSPTIYDIQKGTFKGYNAAVIASSFAGKILNCGATGVVNALLASNCTGADAITIASGGNVTLTFSSITNAQANSNGANITSGGTLTSLYTTWNVPSGTGKAIFGSLGSVWAYTLNTFIANKNYSTSIGAGAVAFPNTPVAA